MKTFSLIAVSAAISSYAAPALAQDAFPTSMYGGLTAEQAQVKISSAGYEIGDIEDDPTFGAVLGGRFNTGARIVLTGELAFNVPTGMQKDPREVYCEAVDCGEELSYETERGIRWSADATLGVGYLVTDDLLVSVGGGPELAEVFRDEGNYEDGALDYSYEHTGYAFGYRAFARAELAFAGGWKGRVEYSYRHLADEKWEASSPGYFSLDQEQSFKGSAIEIGVTKDF